MSHESQQAEPASPVDRPQPQTRGRRRRRWLIGFGLFCLALGLDSLRPPESQWSSRVALLAIDGYQATLSKAMPSMGVECRFTPTCSHYTESAIRSQGLLRGCALGARRLLRCGPWTPPNTHDPPP